MPNMQEKKTASKMQAPQIRATNFEEVNLGYTKEDALNEAQRCLGCVHKPCVKGCPCNVDIPAFIKFIQDDNINQAYEIITENNGFPSICGRVCPQENQCEKHCVRAIKHQSVAIGNLERYVGDHATVTRTKPSEVKGKVAVIGSGPASLAFASDMVKANAEVHIYEALHENGGVLVYGIPEFRLPKDIVKTELNQLQQLGVKIFNNMVIGKIYTVEDLFQQGYQVIFIGVGAGLPRFMGINNENAIGVFSANEYLTRINLMKAYLPNADTPIIEAKHTVVVGGGNVAMDSARSALRMGQKVTVMYRRGMEELPARAEEVEHAIEEGIDFKVLTNPLEVLIDESGRISGLKCQKMQLVDNSDGSRKSFIPIVGTEFDIACDCMIMAIGTLSNPLLTSTIKGLSVNDRGNIIVDNKHQTNIEGVYAAGDIVTGAATVIQAMGHGKIAAKNAIDYLKEKLGNE